MALISASVCIVSSIRMKLLVDLIQTTDFTWVMNDCVLWT